MRAVLALTLLFGCTEKKPAPPSRPQLQASPPAAAMLPVVDAKAVSELLARHRGQPIIVNVFASWCVPCRAELPDLARLKQKAPKLYLLGIDVDQDDAAARAFQPTLPAGMEAVRRPDGIAGLLPAFRLPDDWNQSMPAGWDRTVPLTFAFNAKGEFETGSVGQLGAEALHELESLITSAN